MAPLPLRARTCVSFRQLTQRRASPHAGSDYFYHFRINYNLQFSRVGSSAFFWMRVEETRAVHLVLHCAYSTCTQRHFPQASPAPIGRLAGPMRGRVTHSVACVRACVRGERWSVCALFARQRHARFAWVWRGARTVHSHMIHGSTSYITAYRGGATR